MQPKKALLIRALAASSALTLPKQGQAQGQDQQLFDIGPVANETIYGPLKVIDIPRYPSTFHEYPNIEPEIRKLIENGGLVHTCGSCNQTGCLCPDMNHPNISFNGLCEYCRGMEGGGLRCYCSPALEASPCNTTEPPTTGCADQPEQCHDALPVYFCEPQKWDQNPGLTNLATPSVVYDVQKITVMPSTGPAATAKPSPGGQKVVRSGASKSKFSGLGIGVAAAAVARWTYGW